MKKLLLKFTDFFHLYPLFNRFTMNTGTVFMLHRIHSNRSKKTNCVCPSLLRDYFDYIKKHKYNVISLTDFMKSIINKEDTYKTIVFTVDDGYRNFYENAFDVFREYGFSATIFLTSDFIEGKLFFWWDKIEYAVKVSSKKEIDLPALELNNISISGEKQKSYAISQIVNKCKLLENSFKLAQIDCLIEKLDVDISDQPKGKYAPLTWDEILEMKNNKIEFYPHTKTHPIISKAPLEQKKKELIEPKKLLEGKLNVPMNIFCYPNGRPEDYDEETIEVLKSTEYIAAVTGMAGFVNTKEKTDMYKIPRFDLPSCSRVFKQYISGLEKLKGYY